MRKWLISITLRAVVNLLCLVGWSCSCLRAYKENPGIYSPAQKWNPSLNMKSWNRFLNICFNRNRSEQVSFPSLNLCLCMWQCRRLAVCVPSKFTYWSPNPQWDGVWRRGFGRWLGSDEIMRGGPGMRRVTKELPCVPCVAPLSLGVQRRGMWARSEMSAAFTPREEGLRMKPPCCHCDLGRRSLQHCEK